MLMKMFFVCYLSKQQSRLKRKMELGLQLSRKQS